MAIQTFTVGETVGVTASLNNNFTYLNNLIQPEAKFTTASITAATFSAGQITGGGYTVFTNTNASPGTCTTRTATLMFGDITGAFSGMAYTLRLVQTGAGTMTLGAGTGVTLTGTMTVPQNTTRDFVVTFNSTTTCTIQAIGTGTFS
jgi:hypothetical protein